MTTDQQKHTKGIQLNRKPVPSGQQNKLNIPNLLSAFRLIGSPILAVLAYENLESTFLWLLIGLLLSDWLDGKLAIYLNQQSTFGARLDSIADATMYLALLVGLWYLKLDFVKEEAVWILALGVSFCLTSLTGLIKYHRLPSYHTQMAKLSWFLISVAVIVLFSGGPSWPARIAMAAVILTNLEATVITAILPEWQAGILSCYHALRWRRQHH